jgi:hypothetical protein
LTKVLIKGKSFTDFSRFPFSPSFGQILVVFLPRLAGSPSGDPYHTPQGVSLQRSLSFASDALINPVPQHGRNALSSALCLI